MTVIKVLFVIAVRSLVPFVILVAGVAGMMVLSQRQPPPSRKSEATIPVVQTVPVVWHAKELEIDVDGVVVPYREITLAAEVAGRITWKNEAARAGKTVAKDTKLFTIDKSDYELQLEQLEAELAQAKINHDEVVVELANTKKLIPLAAKQLQLQKNNLGRIAQLQARNAVSISDVENARDAELKAENSLQTLKNEKNLLEARGKRMQSAVEVARKKVEKARVELSRTKISAPISGVIVRCGVEQGNHVQKGAELLTLEDTSKVEVKCNLRMEELAWIWWQTGEENGTKRQQGYQLPKTPVRIVYTLGQREYIWNGVLDRFDGLGLDEKTRTIPCRVVVNNPCDVCCVSTSRNARFSGPSALVRGMFVTVRILAKPQTPLLRFPENAIRPGNKVWRVKNGKVDVVAVEVAQINQGQVIVRADTTELSAADRLIVTPLGFAVEGLAVKEEKGR